MPKTSLIVCVTGMPGSGKTTVAEALASDGFQIISMGDVIREEAKRQGLPLNDVSLGKLMLKLRNELGLGAIAHLIVRKMQLVLLLLMVCGALQKWMY